MNTPLIAGSVTTVVVFALGLYLVIMRNRRIDNQLRLDAKRQSKSNAAIMAIMGLPLEKRVRLARVALSFNDVGPYKMAKAYPAELEGRFKQFADYAIIDARQVNFGRVDITDLRQYDATELQDLCTLMANSMEFLRVCIWMSGFLAAYLNYFLAEDLDKNGTMPLSSMYNGDLVFYMSEQRDNVLPNDYIRTMEGLTV